MSKREKSVNALESPVTEVAAEFPERHVLIKCPGCRRVIDQTKMAENLDVCPRCGRHLRVSGRKRMRITVDAGSFEEWDRELAATDFLEFPGYAEKLEAARDRILQLIRERRPRFVAAFELMTVRGNTLSVSVPTTELRDEILRSRTAMLTRIARLAGIEGALELEVTVNEQVRATRPIRLEDRVKYLTEKNPLVAELRKALDLEVE